MARRESFFHHFPVKMWVLLGLVVVLFVLYGSLFYADQKSQMRAEEERYLATVAQKKIEEIVAWREEHRIRGESALADSFFSAAVAHWLATRDPGEKKRIVERLASYHRHYRYSGAFLVDTEGRLLIGEGGEEKETSFGPETKVYFEQALRERRVVVTDIYLCSYHHVPHLDIVVPLSVLDVTGEKTIAVLILRQSPSEEIYPLLQFWPAPSKSAEVLLVRPEGGRLLVLNELRHRTGTAFSLRLPAHSAEGFTPVAISGTEGRVIEAVDYRGIPVIAAVRRIPDSLSFLIVKVDTAEAFATWRIRGAAIAGGTFLLLLFTLTSIGLWWYRSQKHLYQALYRTEKKQREIEERYRLLVEHAGDAIFVLQGERLVFLNRKTVELMKDYSEEELTTLPFLTFVHPDDCQRVSTNYQRLLMGEKSEDRYAFRVVRKSGEVRWVEVSAVIIEWEGKPASLVFLTDITERKSLEAAREELTAELQQKNEEMENLLYAVSHDLRTPLVNIHGFSTRIQKHLGEIEEVLMVKSSADEVRSALVPLLKEKIPRAIGFVIASAEKMDGLLKSLLKLSRLGRRPHEPEVIDMNRLVDETIKTLEFQVREIGAEVRVDFLPPCFGDRNEIGQVFSNLLDNALKYRDPARPLAIHIGGSAEKEAVTYHVSDTGMGIKKEYQEQIWGLFSRLDPAGPVRGEGIGLTIVRQMVRRNRGRVWLESEPGKGSTFYVSLPRP